MKLHTLEGYIQNIFMVEYDHGLLLLDGCGRADVDMITSFIQDDLGRTMSDLKLIVVTHMHPDHAGGADRLRSLSQARIACHPKAPSWYKSITGRCAHVLDILLMYWVARRIGKPRKKAWFTPYLAPDMLLENGQVLPGFVDWQVLHTPGHTDHDLSLYHAKSNALYVADLIVRVKGRFHPPYPVCHPNQYKASLNKLRGLDQPKLLYAHVQSGYLSNEDLDNLIGLSPNKPTNHLATMVSRVKRVFTIGR